MFHRTFRLQALAGAAATPVRALALAASPRTADAAQYPFALQDPARFTGLLFAGLAAVGGLVRRRSGGRS